MNNSIIVDNIKLLCKQNNISISSMEKNLGLSPGLISRWTKVIPSLDRLIDIAKFFDVSLDSIVGNQPGHSIISREQQLIDFLINESFTNKIRWNYLIPDGNNFPEEFGNYISTIFYMENEYDCFYTTFENGYFLLQASYSAKTGNINSLVLYIFPDKHTMPSPQSNDLNLLKTLYQTIRAKLDPDISEYKTTIFVDKFMEKVSQTPPQSYGIISDTQNNSNKITKIS